MIKTSLKNQAVAFVLITFAISWVEVYFIAASAEGVNDPLPVLALMWTPGVVALVLSWIFGSKFQDIGFKRGSWRHYLVSYLVPAVSAMLILLVLIIFGLGQFEISPKLIGKSGTVAGALFKLLVLLPVLGAVVSFFSGLGEELGWRGFLHTKLMAIEIPHPFLITGFIWAVWHWPLILFSNYATSDLPILSLALFTVAVISLSVFMGWMREKSGSVFPAALTHGVHNLWVQSIYPALLLKGPLDAYFGGESGVIIAVIYGSVAVFIYQRYLVRGRPT